MGWGHPLEFLVDRDAEFDGGITSLSVALPLNGFSGQRFCQHQVIPFGAPVAVNGFSWIGGLLCRGPAFSSWIGWMSWPVIASCQVGPVGLVGWDNCAPSTGGTSG